LYWGLKILQKQHIQSFSRKNRKILPVMLLILGAVLIMASGAGSVKVPFLQTLKIIVKNIWAVIIAVIEPVMARVPFLKNAGTALRNSGLLFQNAVFEEGHEQIIYLIRLPRVLMAVVTGAALSTSGAVMQCLFRNPMADPGILGVSSGAGLGAVIAIGTGLTAYSIYFLPLFASIGSLSAAFLIFALSVRKGKVPVMNLILSGIAVSMFLSAVTTVLLSFISGDQVKQYIFWTVGNLNRSRWESLGLVILPVLICTTVLLLLAKELNVMLLGEEEAQSVGLNPASTRKLMLIISSVNTAVCVAVTGTISFVGLIVPHIMRIIVGPDHRVLLPASVVGGAIFLVLCDLVGRVVLIPEEISAGIITSLVGAPYFLFLLNRTKRGEGFF
jgi:iron complex transport system permease protein